ncbi:MAG: prepilin-type N-terminal cleavage/methylation domain-containing protein [Clostridiales Family XIII bacterium]|nr:prepilin-type N-terminal cleavage/methylation domain-containing protein [Clostridiales Family XIII bacterium]
MSFLRFGAASAQKPRVAIAPLSRLSRCRKGFTLVEVIVVIVIIAILAAIGVPALTGYIGKAHEKELIAVANTSAKALQAWATEQYAYGNIGNEKLMDMAADSFSLAGYTGEPGRFGPNGSAGGSIVTAEYHPGSGDGVMDKAESDEEGFLFAALNPGDVYHDGGVTLTYHFKGKDGKTTTETVQYSIIGYFELPSMIAYADVACGQPGTKYIKTPPALPEGYRARADTQKLIDDKVDLPYEDWDYDYDGYAPYWEGMWYGDLYYEASEEEIEDENGKNEDGNEGGNEGEEASSGWISIVDLFASTGYGSEGYVITDVEFSDQNLLTHMRLTAPGGDFVVYADETYHHNLDPAMGSST